MAKTTKKKASSAPGRQAPAGVWAPSTLMEALVRGTIEDKVAVLRKAGILDENNKLSSTYKNWGSKVTRTPYATELLPR
jgi:hypothetical protein